MPAFEVADRRRADPSDPRAGSDLIGAVGLHAALVAILGPWNLGHSPNVLVWNGAMIVEDLLLFRSSRDRTHLRGSEAIVRSGRPPGSLARSSSIVFPLGERLGLSDSWPSHALYASHCERAEVYLHARTTSTGSPIGSDGASPRPVKGPGGGST